MIETRTCPGCGLEMPRSDRSYDHYFNASPECWSLFGEIGAREFENPALLGQIHQLTVDTCAVQHAGGPHPDKSVCIHLVGLYLALERGMPPERIRPAMQRLAARGTWPHLEPPQERRWLTTYEVVLAATPEEHVRLVRQWAEQVWHAWSAHHAIARALAGEVISEK
jgi:hypothetical protein